MKYILTLDISDLLQTASNEFERTANNVESEDSAEFTIDAYQTLPLSYDKTHNLAVCIGCCCGLPFEWIHSHLKHQHGISKTSEEILEHLNLEVFCMSLAEAKRWLSEGQSIERAIDTIPVVPRYCCIQCGYSCAISKGMQNHFSSKHKGCSWIQGCEKCQVKTILNILTK